MLQTHIELFGTKVYQDFEYWHQFLEEKWMNGSPVDVQSAVDLLSAIHREMAERLTNAPVNDESSLNILKFFVSYFVKILERGNAEPHEIRIAFRGFGLMARPCSKLNQLGDLDYMLTLITQRSECESTLQSASKKESLEYFPDYVQTMSQVLEYANGLSDIQRANMQNIITLSMRNFHLLSKTQHKTVIVALVATYKNLSKLGGTMLKDVLERTILQGVIWTCSHKLPHDARVDWENSTDWKEQATFRSFLPLWQGLIALHGKDSRLAPEISSEIFDQLMEALFAILDRLNLRTKKRKYRTEAGEDQELFFSDPDLDLEPEVPKDYHIFFNLTDFYDQVLKSLSIEQQRLFFLRWAPQFIRHMISKSIKFPLVSGFLKLLKASLTIAGRLKLFDSDMSDEHDFLAKDVMCFLQGMITKATQCNGELQISCAKLVLSAPTVFIQKLVRELLPVFEISFEIGRATSDISLASSAFSAVERYTKASSPESDELKEILQQILPCLNPYLKGFSGNSDEVISIRYGKRKPKKMSEPDMQIFQKRILAFLGNLEPPMCAYLLANDEKELNLVKWGGEKNVIPVVFFNTDGSTMNIMLDAVLPRICTIAATSTDRQKKMSACELVHAAILYIIGAEKLSSDVWRELCYLMLQLGCDADTAVQQMFEPLVMQVMHFMSGDDKINISGFGTLLECLMETLSHPSESILRDFAARCLRELLTWSIKQATHGRITAGSTLIISDIFEKINLLNTDLQQPKRSGAALAFNNLYRVMREDDSVISEHCLQLFYGFCLNYQASDDVEASSMQSQVNLEQVSMSIDNLVRIIRERRSLFNAAELRRKVPPEFEEGKLLNVVEWLFQQWSSQHVNYRRKMVTVFKQLVVCVDGLH